MSVNHDEISLSGPTDQEDEQQILIKLLREYQPPDASEPSSLCSSCSAIPFDPKSPDFGEKHTIGTYVEIFNRRSCPMCRLVTSLARRCLDIGYYKGSWQDHLSSDTITITWYPELAGFISNYFGLGARLYFLDDENGAAQNLPRSGKTIPDQIDFQLAARWLQACEKEHGTSCHSEKKKGQDKQSFRVIDAENVCIVNAPEECRYLTLSYVWGNVQTVKLFRENKHILMAHRGLDSVWETLPRTIADAIEFVRLIGERYLWVDALCLIQNDASDMKQGIFMMDQIYEESIATIIAASGQDAAFPLPGVQPDSRAPRQMIEEIRPGYRMLAIVGLDDCMKDSIYETRAWTFQEQFLSKRTFIFINDQVYFRCRGMICSEESCLVRKLGNAVWGNLLELAHDPDTSTADAYDYIVHYYSPRNLTHQSDALYALTGVMKRMSERMRCEFLEGLPKVMFDSFILFIGWDKRARRRRGGFPSWSWVGWIGGVTWQQHDVIWDTENISDLPTISQWLSEKTWIVWYSRDSSGKLSEVWDEQASNAFLSGAKDEDLGYRARKPFLLPTVPQDLDYREAYRLRGYTLLQFWSVSARFGISEPFIHSDWISVNLYDREQNFCGWIPLDTADDIDSSVPQEIIVLSESLYALPSSTFPEALKKKAKAKEDQDTWGLYWVMLIVIVDGVAERRGLGQIYQKSLVGSIGPGPQWKEIILG